MYSSFAWDRDHQCAFDTLKKALCNVPVFVLMDPKEKYSLHIDASHYASCMVLSQVQDKMQKVLGYVSQILSSTEIWYSIYDRELLGIQDMILCWKFNLYNTMQPLLAYINHVTLSWIFTKPHITIYLMDMQMVTQNNGWEDKCMLGIWNYVMDVKFPHLDFWGTHWNLIGLQIPAAGKWIDDVKTHIIDDEWFGLIVHFSAN